MLYNDNLLDLAHICGCKKLGGVISEEQEELEEAIAPYEAKYPKVAVLPPSDDIEDVSIGYDERDSDLIQMNMEEDIRELLDPYINIKGLLEKDGVINAIGTINRNMPIKDFVFTFYKDEDGGYDAYPIAFEGTIGNQERFILYKDFDETMKKRFDDAYRQYMRYVHGE